VITRLNDGEDRGGSWPEPPSDWEDTRATFHLWTQVIGKIRMACTPLASHWWNTPFYVTARGLTTSLIPHGVGRGFQIDFDLIDHQLVIVTTDGSRRSYPLRPESVAVFYRTVMRLLDDLGMPVQIWTMPVEIADAISFDEDDEHASYDAEQVERFWRTLVESHRVLEIFRSRYLGKTSPVHLFWGALDLATSRFSGHEAPPHPGGAPHCGPHVMLEAYSREVSSAGYWPGPTGSGCYYSYVYPEPPGFRTSPAQPTQATYQPDLGEFTLRYEVVRNATDPDGTLLAFLQSTYDAAAERGGWNRTLLERPHQPLNVRDFRPSSRPAIPE
jgi:Family of unknown function (DUF5996)